MIGLLVVLLVLGLILGGAYLFQRKLIYLPSTGTVAPANEVLPGARDVSFVASDGVRLRGWYLPARATVAGEPAATVLVAAGNGGDRSLRAPLASALAERGLSVLLFDYRGYGDSEGSPSEEGLLRDARAAHDFLVGELGAPADELRYFGESLGAAVLTRLAAERPPAAMVLRSPFTELADVAARQYPFLPARWLLKDRFPVAELARRIQTPTTVVFGSADSIVPAEQSRAVAEAFPNGTAIEVPGADHNDPVLLSGNRVIDAVARR
nr:alpha/beta fold hydrolase [Tamaricihabitans halophyticus]